MGTVGFVILSRRDFETLIFGDKTRDFCPGVNWVESAIAEQRAAGGGQNSRGFVVGQKFAGAGAGVGVVSCRFGMRATFGIFGLTTKTPRHEGGGEKGWEIPATMIYTGVHYSEHLGLFPVFGTWISDNDEGSA